MTKLYTNAEIRRTFRYVAAYAHLDQYEPADTEIRITEGPMNTRHDVCGIPEVSQQIYIRTVSPMSAADIRDFLSGEYDKGCACEHDCCGHWFGGARRIRQANKRGTRFTAIVSYSRNY